VVSIGGLVVAHVGWRLLLSRTPRQCAMPRHNGNHSVPSGPEVNPNHVTFFRFFFLLKIDP